ncbi:hypothetical protein [Micromonospora sp. HM5-17]|jgi:hypothetical protein|uniref:hypothetical protein n=1 Tax=Micromonospora sp. HM5-17 TaxID=2487710 RepID=UPI000F45F7B6|nr:hypothetical protein [Micromonospora sp. HM5-17]ROT29302.1 hypothetical protein EF879_20110 [Micromonospora sp. HM5-17]
MGGHTGRNPNRSESARIRGHAGSGARGRQGVSIEKSEKQRRQRAATGTASTERDHGRATVSRGGRRHTQGTG